MQWKRVMQAVAVVGAVSVFGGGQALGQTPPPDSIILSKYKDSTNGNNLANANTKTMQDSTNGNKLANATEMATFDRSGQFGMPVIDPLVNPVWLTGAKIAKDAGIDALKRWVHVSFVFDVKATDPYRFSEMLSDKSTVEGSIEVKLHNDKLKWMLKTKIDVGARFKANGKLEANEQDGDKDGDKDGGKKGDEDRDEKGDKDGGKKGDKDDEDDDGAVEVEARMGEAKVEARFVPRLCASLAGSCPNETATLVCEEDNGYAAIVIARYGPLVGDAPPSVMIEAYLAPIEAGSFFPALAEAGSPRKIHETLFQLTGATEAATLALIKAYDAVATALAKCQQERVGVSKVHVALDSDNEIMEIKEENATSRPLLNAEPVTASATEKVIAAEWRAASRQSAKAMIENQGP